MKRTKVYIAGPVTGLPRDQVIAEFARYEKYLTTLGYEVVNPMKIVPPDAAWDEAMILCIYHLNKCDKAVFMEGWQHSRGASMEMEFCTQQSIPLLSRTIIKELWKDKAYNKKTA